MAALLSIKLRNIPYYYEVDGAMAKYHEGKAKKILKVFSKRSESVY